MVVDDFVNSVWRSLVAVKHVAIPVLSTFKTTTIAYSLAFNMAGPCTMTETTVYASQSASLRQGSGRVKERLQTLLDSKFRRSRDDAFGCPESGGHDNFPERSCHLDAKTITLA